jgi:hypothetical protein
MLVKMKKTTDASRKTQYPSGFVCRKYSLLIIYIIEIIITFIACTMYVTSHSYDSYPLYYDVIRFLTVIFVCLMMICCILCENFIFSILCFVLSTVRGLFFLYGAFLFPILWIALLVQVIIVIIWSLFIRDLYTINKQYRSLDTDTI